MSVNGILARNQLAAAGVRDYEDFSISRAQSLRGEVAERQTGKKIHDFVPLYFVSHTPTLRHICFWQHEWDSTAILRLCLSLLADEHNGIHFTNGGCIYEGVEFYTRFEDLPQLRWDLLMGDYDELRKSVDSHELKLRTSAEVLVPETIDRSYIDYIAVRTKRAKRHLQSVFLDEMRPEVRVEPELYPTGGSTNKA